MSGNKFRRMTENAYAHEQLQRKTVLPFSVKEIEGPHIIKAWREQVEAKSVSKREEARQRTIEAWTQVQANRKAWAEGTWAPPVKTQEKQEVTLLTKIVNWFTKLPL